jgi:uncharacterized protein (DUF2236 family)
VRVILSYSASSPVRGHPQGRTKTYLGTSIVTASGNLRPPLRTIIALTWRLKLARLFLWLARVTDTYDGVVMRIVRHIVESAEAVARKSDRLRRLL